MFNTIPPVQPASVFLCLLKNTLPVSELRDAMNRVSTGASSQKHSVIPPSPSDHFDSRSSQMDDTPRKRLWPLSDLTQDWRSLDSCRTGSGWS